MAKLHAQQLRCNRECPTEAEKVKKAAAMMIETPLDLIRHILQRHEESVIEVMRELTVENERLRAELQHIANANPSHWEPDVRDQFQAWAQSRARAALTYESAPEAPVRHRDRSQQG